MARQLSSIKGLLFTSTGDTEKTHGEIYDDIRAIEGVVTLSTRSLDKNKSDLGNKSYLYDKAFQDTITQRDLSNTKQQNVHKIPIIEDDSLGYVYNINFNFIEKEEEKLIINIYICDKDFNITDLIDKHFKL